MRDLALAERLIRARRLALQAETVGHEPEADFWRRRCDFLLDRMAEQQRVKEPA